MTFTEREINGIELDFDTDWQFEDNGFCSVCVYPGSYIRDKVLTFLDLDLDNVYIDMWLDCYVTINARKRVVTKLYFVVPFDDYSETPNELEIHITNFTEGRNIFLRLEEVGKMDFSGFIDEACR